MMFTKQRVVWGLTLLMSVAILVPMIYAQEPTQSVLFHDDFSGDLSNWHFDLSTDGRPDYFSPHDGSMVFAPVWFGNAFAGDPEWTDYVLEIEFEVLEYGNYGNTRVFVRSNALWQGYGASILPEAVWFDRFDGNWDQRTQFDDIAVETRPGERITVRIEVKGNVLKLYYNDEFLAEAEDPDNVYPVGRIGLRADHNSIKVYRVSVWEN